MKLLGKLLEVVITLLGVTLLFFINTGVFGPVFGTIFTLVVFAAVMKKGQQEPQKTV